MNLLDTDTLPLLMSGHERVRNRVEQATRPAITIVTRIEVLRGRFAFLLKAADGSQVLRAQGWLDENERFMDGLETTPFNEVAAAAFDKLRLDKKLKKIGRADVLNASIALAWRATVITRNLRHFQQIPGLVVENWAD